MSCRSAECGTTMAISVPLPLSRTLTRSPGLSVDEPGTSNIKSIADADGVAEGGAATRRAGRPAGIVRFAEPQHRGALTAASMIAHVAGINRHANPQPIDAGNFRERRRGGNRLSRLSAHGFDDAGDRRLNDELVRLVDMTSVDDGQSFVRRLKIRLRRRAGRRAPLPPRGGCRIHPSARAPRARHVAAPPRARRARQRHRARP